MHVVWKFTRSPAVWRHSTPSVHLHVYLRFDTRIEVMTRTDMCWSYFRSVAAVVTIFDRRRLWTIRGAIYAERTKPFWAHNANGFFLISRTENTNCNQKYSNVFKKKMFLWERVIALDSNSFISTFIKLAVWVNDCPRPVFPADGYIWQTTDNSLLFT